MNVNVYIENNLSQQLNESAKALHKSRNAIIREAIQDWLLCHKAHTWPAAVLNYKGDARFPRFESHRKTLKKAKDDPFE